MSKSTSSHDSEQEGPYLATGNLEGNPILYLQRILKFRKLERPSRKRVFLRFQVFLKHQKGHRGSQPFHLWAAEKGNDHITAREGQVMTRMLLVASTESRQHSSLSLPPKGVCHSIAVNLSCTGNLVSENMAGPCRN